MKRSDIPEVRAGSWVQFGKVAPVQDDPPHTVHLVDFGELGSIRTTPDALHEAGFTVRVFDYEPGPTELVMPKDVVTRAVAAELDAATARAEAYASDRARLAAEQALATQREVFRKREEYPRFFARVNAVRVRLLTSLLEYTWAAVYYGKSLPVPPHELHADALRRPCPSYDTEPFVDQGDPEEVPDPNDVGTPCVRAYDHEGRHADVTGKQFDAEPLFAYLPNPFTGDLK